MNQNRNHLMPTRSLLFAAMTSIACSSAFAKDWQVQMLSYGEKGPMVFEPDFIQAQVGDTVTFLPTQPGHHVASALTPDQQKAWSSKLNETYTVELTEEGVNLYYCPPHLMMGMVGVIQVGEAVNKESLDQFYPSFRNKIALNPERVDAILEQVK